MIKALLTMGRRGRGFVMRGGLIEGKGFGMV